VVAPAVDLDDESVRRPVRVNLVAGHSRVHLGQGEARRPTESFESLLALGAGELRVRVVFLEDEPHHRGLFSGPLDLVRRGGSCQVVEGPGGVGDGQAVVNYGIEGGGAVDTDAVAGSPRLAFDGDVHDLVGSGEAPDRRCRLVAQRSAAREDRR
jgi:hypothetical protein